MKRLRLFLLAVAALVAVSAVAPSGASAEALYRYTVSIANGARVDNLNPALNTTIRLVRSGTQVQRQNYSPGPTGQANYNGTIQSGDVVEVYQGALPLPALDPPATPPTESFTVPPLTITGTAGSSVLSGATDANATVRASSSSSCDEFDTSVVAANSGGAYSATFPAALQGGDYTRVTAIQPDGDTTVHGFRIPGDAGCMNVDASARASGPQIYNPPVDPTPYEVYEGGIDFDAIPTVRIVLRRGGAIIADENSSGLELTPAQKPLAGDIVDVYRPQGAATPVRSYTIPAVSAVFDPGNDLVAVSAPASLLTYAAACREFDCSSFSQRSARNLPAGRTLFSFAQPLGYDRALDLLPTDQVTGGWTSVDARFNVSVDAVPGDLTSPIGKITLAKKLKLRKIGKRIKFKLNSTEAGTAVSTLTTTRPGKPKKKSKKGSKSAAKKPVTLATATTKIKVGKNSVSLKRTKQGRKTIAKIIASGKSQVGTLTVTLTDASGNATTVVKSTKLVLK